MSFLALYVILTQHVSLTLYVILKHYVILNFVQDLSAEKGLRRLAVRC